MFQTTSLKVSHITWKWRMMVHISPRVSLGFPSAISSFLMLTSLTWKGHGYWVVSLFALWTAFWIDRKRRIAHLKVSLFSDLSVFEKVQGDLYILQLVEAHPAFLPRLQERRGRRTSGGANASGLDDQQTARAPMTEERVFQVSSNTLCVHKQPSILL